MPYGGAAAGPTCPGTATVGTNAVLNSTHWYEIVNDTDEEILVDILMELSDSDGNHTSESHSPPHTAVNPRVTMRASPAHRMATDESARR